MAAETEQEHGSLLDELLGEADDYALEEEHEHGSSEHGGSEAGEPQAAEESRPRQHSLAEELEGMEHEADDAQHNRQHGGAAAASPAGQQGQQQHHEETHDNAKQQQGERLEQQPRKRHAEGDAHAKEEQPPAKKGRIIDLNAHSARSPQKRTLDGPLQRRPHAGDGPAPAARQLRAERPAAVAGATAGAPAMARRRPPSRFFVIKCANEANFQLSREFSAWATQPHNERMFDEAFAKSERVFLLLSINNSGRFQGCARMASHAGAGPRSVPWEGIALPVNNFSVIWQVVQDLPYSELGDLTNPWNDNKPVKIARDGQELPPELGEELVARMLMGARARGGPLVPPVPGARMQGAAPNGPRMGGGPSSSSSQQVPFAADGRLIPHSQPPPPPRRGGGPPFERGPPGMRGDGMRGDGMRGGDWDGPGPQRQLDRRMRSRSPPLRRRRSRSPDPDSHLPELLDMSYEEYLEWYSKVQRTMKDMKEVARVSKRSQSSREVAADLAGVAGDRRDSGAEGLGRGAAPLQLPKPPEVLAGPGGGAAAGAIMPVAGNGGRGPPPPAAGGAMGGGFAMGAGGGLMSNMMSEDDYIRQCQMYYQRNGFPAPDAEMIRAYYRSVRASLEGGMMAGAMPGAMPGMMGAMPNMASMMMGMAGAMGRGGMAAMPGMMGAAMMPMMAQGRGMAAMRGRPPQRGQQRGDYF